MNPGENEATYFVKGMHRFRLEVNSLQVGVK